MTNETKTQNALTEPQDLVAKIEISHEMFAEIVKRRIEGHSSKETWVGNRRFDPTHCERAKCRISMGDWEGGDPLSGPDPIIRRFEIEYVESEGLSFEIVELAEVTETGRRALQDARKALYDFHSREFVQNGAWDSNAAIELATELLARGVWYGLRDREPDAEDLF